MKVPKDKVDTSTFPTIKKKTHFVCKTGSNKSKGNPRSRTVEGGILPSNHIRITSVLQSRRGSQYQISR